MAQDENQTVRDAKPSTKKVVPQPIPTKEKPFVATLTNGKVYMLGSKRFDAGIPQLVTPDEAARLRGAFTQHALHNADETMTSFERPRFTITQGEPVVRRRTRATADVGPVVTASE